MLAYNGNKPQQYRISFVDLASRTMNIFQHKPQDTFDCFDVILTEPEEPLKAYFWDKRQTVSSQNSYWT
jgi:hypothetical protein